MPLVRRELVLAAKPHTTRPSSFSAVAGPRQDQVLTSDLLDGRSCSWPGHRGAGIYARRGDRHRRNDIVTRGLSAACHIAGSLGTLIGADHTNLNKVRGLGAPVASIGGAGTFDGIFLTGILAVLLASLYARPRAAQAR